MIEKDSPFGGNKTGTGGQKTARTSAAGIWPCVKCTPMSANRTCPPTIISLLSIVGVVYVYVVPWSEYTYM